MLPRPPRAGPPRRETAVSPAAATRALRPGWPTRSAPGPDGRAARSRQARSGTPPFPTTGPPPPPWSRNLLPVNQSVVLSKQRWRAGRPQRLAVDEDPVAADPQRPAGVVRVGQLGEEAAVPELGQPGRLRHGQDPRGGHPGGAQDPFPLQRRPGAQSRVQLLVERVAVPLAGLAVGEPRVGRQAGPAYLLAEGLELLLAVGRDVQRAVRCVEGT